MNHLRRTAIAAVTLAALLAAPAAPPAGATVPPSVCKTIKVKGKRYSVRADRMRCSTAEKRAKTFLTSHRKPSGYTCKTYKSGAMAFMCRHSTKQIPLFYAVKT